MPAAACSGSGGGVGQGKLGPDLVPVLVAATGGGIFHVGGEWPRTVVFQPIRNFLKSPQSQISGNLAPELVFDSAVVRPTSA